LVPLVKGFSTEMSQWVSSIGVQVHGGMGFIEETGAAQFYRDSKILTIYEGTTAIQANDLLGRKTLRDGGRFAARLSAMIEETLGAMAHEDHEDLLVMSTQLRQSKGHFDQAVQFMLSQGLDAPNRVYAGSVPYLILTSSVVVAWLFAKSMLVCREQMTLHPEDRFYFAKLKTARFFAEHILPQTQTTLQSIVQGWASVNALSLEDF